MGLQRAIAIGLIVGCCSYLVYRWVMRGERMPRAVTVATETFHYDLKTCPEGFVDLRKLTYGERLYRREHIAKMRTQRQIKGSQSSEMEVDMQLERVAIFEFARSIVAHNLEDVDGRQLNFTNAQDVLRMDPQIAGEIEDLIDKLNEPPEEEKSGEDAPLAETSGFLSPPSTGNDLPSANL